MESTLPPFPEFLKGARGPSDDGDCQLPCRVDATSIVTPPNRYNAPMVPQPQNVLTQSGSTAKATGLAVASKKRNRDFHQLFSSVPEDDCLIDDYSCAWQRDIILTGRLYVSESHVCFSSNILGWMPTLIISFDEIVSVEKENTATVFPNAIAIQTVYARQTFRRLFSREAYDLLIYIWKIDHPSLKSSLNSVRLEDGTGDKTEKVDPSPFEHSSARNASRIEESEVAVLSKDQAVHEALQHKDQPSSNSALLASRNKKHTMRREAPEDTFPIEKKRQRRFRYDAPSTAGLSFTKTGSSASSKTLRAKPSVRCTSSRRSTLETDNSDVDQVVQHKVKEGKVAHKRAEQIRRNELSSLITELEHCLPSEFLDGCQPRNQKPGYTKNGTLKAMLTYHKHQAAVIEEQDKIIEAQAAANVALKERNVALMQQGQQCGTGNERPG